VNLLTGKFKNTERLDETQSEREKFNHYGFKKKEMTYPEVILVGCGKSVNKLLIISEIVNEYFDCDVFRLNKIKYGECYTC
jgi:hypothetical protein